MVARADLMASNLGAPVGLYSHGFMAERGRTLMVAGQLAVDARQEVVGRDDFAAQMRQVFDNFGEVLQAAGMSFDNVVKFTTYLVHPDDIANFYDVRVQLFPTLFSTDVYPPNTLLVIQRLVRPEFRIEVEGIACDPPAAAVVRGGAGT
jgi:enamine deaminase RidA (YjgF/YER057c/UK114 family)